MEKMTAEQIMKLSENGVCLIKEGKYCRNFFTAIIGIARDKSHLVYSRDKLIQCFIQIYDCKKEKAEAWLEALTVSYLTDSYSEHTPRILMNKSVPEGNKCYKRIKVVDI